MWNIGETGDINILTEHCLLQQNTTIRSSNEIPILKHSTYHLLSTIVNLNILSIQICLCLSFIECVRVLSNAFEFYGIVPDCRRSQSSSIRCLRAGILLVPVWIRAIEIKKTFEMYFVVTKKEHFHWSKYSMQLY